MRLVLEKKTEAVNAYLIKNRTVREREIKEEEEERTLSQAVWGTGRSFMGV